MEDTKRQVLPANPGLWIIATPIGNLGDFTDRGRQALQTADVILCEDTRRSSKLLAAFGIQATLRRFDAHSTDKQIAAITEELLLGKNIALVTDAGTPGISDPAAALVAHSRSSGVQVSPIPGASAVAAVMSVAGLKETAFAFLGFFPRKPNDQKSLFDNLLSAAAVCRVFIWFESPERIVESLKHLQKLTEIYSWTEKVHLVCAKELTKIYEKVIAGSIQSVAAQVEQEILSEGCVGEWCFVMELPVEASDNSNSSEWVKALQCLLDAGVSASEAAKRVSQYFGVGKNQVYKHAISSHCKKTDEGG